MATKKETTKGKGTGYREKTAISMRPAEGWSAEPQTEERVIELANMIVSGASRETVQEYAKETYKVGDRQVRAYYGAAMRYLLPENEDEYRNTLIQANMSRLETIIERCMSGNDYKNAIAAIKEINNVLNPNKNTVMIGKKGDAEIIKIDFN